MQRWSGQPKMGRVILLVMQTCLMAFWRRLLYRGSFKMTIPRRGRKELLGEEELMGLDGLLNLTFFIPMRLPMLR